MSLQARTSQWDHRLYNPSGDLAHNFQQVVTAVAERLDRGTWAEAQRYVTDHAVTDEQLAAASAAFIEFVKTATAHPKERMEDALRRSGWFDVRPEAQVAYMANFGLVVAGLSFRRVREAHASGDNTVALPADELVKAGTECSRLMTSRPWARWLRRKLDQLRLALGR